MKRRRIRTSAARVLVLGTILALGGGGGCGRPPQIGADREAFKAVDALYTAVSLREDALVTRCASKLSQLRDSGKLPRDASQTLEDIINEARGGRWEPAQSRLARFMEGQRR